MIEFLLSLFYFILFCLLISRMSFFKDPNIPQFWFIILFGLKIITSIILTSIYTHYYTDRSTADIYKYFDDSKIMFDALFTNPIDYLKMLIGIDSEQLHTDYYHNMAHWLRPYLGDLFSDTHVIIRINAVIRLFSFGHFQVHNIFMNFISLIGLTLIFKAFKQFLHQKEKALFYLISLVPSVLFWGSGLLKESIIFFAFGLFFYNLFLLHKTFKTQYLLLIIISIVLIIFTKFYLLTALFIPVFGYLINLKIKKPVFSYISSIVLFFISINILPLLNDQLNLVQQVVNKQQTFSHFITIVDTNSGFLIPRLSDGLSILINTPNALLNTIIRPFFWECHSPFVWLSAIENLAIIVFIFISIYFRKKMNSEQKSVFFLNIIFVFILFSLIGLTTPVFGAIIRYKIPGLILLMISLLMLVDIDKIKALHPLFKKIL